MKSKLFGTDGIRGTANSEPMTAETALRVAKAAGQHFIRGDHRHLAVIGKDTRLSGYLIEPALTAGFISMGMDVVLLGPLPTPAVAVLTRSLRADLGVVISASHNPFEDNGIKLFGPDGFKLSDAVEREIEERVESGVVERLAAPDHLGRARRLDDAQGRYIEYVKNTFPKGLRLDGLKIVIDCANGAAYRVAPTVLWELGADVVPVGVEPDGFNINKDCGATETTRMQQEVRKHKADLGISLDGDGDRVILADETGAILDGDQIMALIAKTWQKANLLEGEAIAATVMSNLGLDVAFSGLHRALVVATIVERHPEPLELSGATNLRPGHPFRHDSSYFSAKNSRSLSVAVKGSRRAQKRESSKRHRKLCTPPRHECRTGTLATRAAAGWQFL